MDKLNLELSRLYLPEGAMPDGRVRSIALPFRKWENLCAVANALQGELDLPAPAVSVASGGGYVLWLSLAAPVEPALAREFVALLGQAHPDRELAADVVGAPAGLPPRLDAANGKWSAFIHPGMGASFADEPGLDMAPPPAGQLALLEGLHSIGADQLQLALDTLRRTQVQAQQQPQAHAPSPRHDAIPDGLLLKDATLEDIVRFLHAKHIEPTFRHLIPPA
jgi:hypothetical protein